MINKPLNLFRTNKRYTFYPDICCSGTGAAVAEFLKYKEVLEKASECKVVLVATKQFFGWSGVVYEIREQNNDKAN